MNDFDLTRAVVNEIRFQGSRCGPFDRAIDFLVRRRPPLASIISAEFPLDRTAEAIEQAMNLPKVAVRPQALSRG